MNKYLLITLLTSIFLSPAVLSQEPFEEAPAPQEEMEHEIFMNKMELEERQHEAQMDFGRQSRQIELQRQKMDLLQREGEINFEENMRRLELEKQRMALKNKQQRRKHPGGDEGMFPLLAIFCIVHILVAVWVFQDIRRRNAGSGIWIVLGLLTGLLGALVYAVVRLGDSRQTQ